MCTGRESSAGGMTGCGMGDRGIVVRFPGRTRNVFCFLNAFSPAVRPTQASHSVVSRTPSSVVKRPEREADH